MALRDLVVRGPMPKPKKKKPDALYPLHTDDDNTWLYVEGKHLLIVHEVRDKGAYVRTVQVPVKWVHIKTALMHHESQKAKA